MLLSLFPALRERFGDLPAVIGGYSLGGLFSLWAAAQTDSFRAVAAGVCRPFGRSRIIVIFVKTIGFCMASNADFVQYIVDQCSGAGEIAAKKMMGDYCIYCDGILFGLICDNNLYVKVTEPGKAVLKEVILRPPYDGAKDYFYISDVDDRDYLTTLIEATIPALPKQKIKRNPMK